MSAGQSVSKPTIVITDEMVEAALKWIAAEYAWSDFLLADASPFDVRGILAAAMGGPWQGEDE